VAQVGAVYPRNKSIRLFILKNNNIYITLVLHLKQGKVLFYGDNAL
jgi:hypothetical protein